jgi:NosR/NirI family nitrous oxide reductase transcriptional regulator
MYGGMKSETSGENSLNHKLNHTQRQRLLASATIALVVAAWVIGYFSSDSVLLETALEVIPGAARVEQQGALYVGYSDTETQEVVGYASVGQAIGYGGPIKVIVGVDTQGEVLGLKVVEQRETPGFYRLIGSFKYLDQFTNKDISSRFSLENDIDGVSGATMSAEGIAAATRQAVRLIANDGLQTPLPPEKKPIIFGGPEISLIALFAVAYIANRQKNQKLKLRLRWTSLVGGMILLGFVYTIPLTISQVTAFLSGYWPDWHNHLYWYLLIGGIIFVTTLEAKNPYCYWFCPFGAFQEVLARATNATVARPRQWKGFLVWLPRVLALTAIILGLLFREPGLVGYEPFATLFDLRGTTLEWILLILTILASLIVYRPFCNFICPIDPVVVFIGVVRNWIRETGMQWKRRTKN